MQIKNSTISHSKNPDGSVGNNMNVIKEVKSQLSSKFGMMDLGAANFILGMEIKRDRANRKL
jgi:hypothetical protein